MTKSAEYWIDHLRMIAHPEGGYYVETYRPSSPAGDRATSTGIYFLLRAGEVSHFHKIDADEMWHFYIGDPLTVHMIDPAGDYSNFTLGNDPDKGQIFQAVVPADIWFGAAMDADTGYALVGCTVAPGFQFEGFELAERESMMADYPARAEIIKRLTPGK